MKSNRRLTKINKNGGAQLIKPMNICKAIKKLYDYENTGMTPGQILSLQNTVLNLQIRIKEMEMW